MAQKFIKAKTTTQLGPGWGWRVIRAMPSGARARSSVRLMRAGLPRYRFVIKVRVTRCWEEISCTGVQKLQAARDLPSASASGQWDDGHRLTGWQAQVSSPWRCREPSKKWEPWAAVRGKKPGSNFMWICRATNMVKSRTDFPEAILILTWIW